MLVSNLVKLYIPLILWVGLGAGLGRILPIAIPHALGKGLFWVGVPLSIFGFLRLAHPTESIWLAPVVAWVALTVGAGLAWLWILFQPRLGGDRTLSHNPSRGSFLLASMFGNTGYLGYPVTLALLGPNYFGWAIFYDTMGSTFGAYVVGVILGAHFGKNTPEGTAPDRRALAIALVNNPGLWSFGLGLLCRNVPFPPLIEQSLVKGAWLVLVLALLLLGMRLGQLQSWLHVPQAAATLSIKMIMIPLVFGIALRTMGITGAPCLALVLQMAMPPAFATLMITEAYDLDRQLTVTCLAVGTVALLLTLPLWILLFAP